MRQLHQAYLSNNCFPRSLSQVSNLWVGPGVDIDQLDQQGTTALWLASKQGHLSAVAFLLEAKASTENLQLGAKDSPLHQAAFAGHWEVVNTLLSKRCSCDPVDEQETRGTFASGTF